LIFIITLDVWITVGVIIRENLFIIEKRPYPFDGEEMMNR